MIRKTNIAPVPAYENWIESQTVQDLQAIRFNHNSIHMESLTIRERILTTKCPDVAHPIVFRGAVCADNGRFDRCESLWLHALELRQNNNVSIIQSSYTLKPQLVSVSVIQSIHTAPSIVLYTSIMLMMEYVAVFCRPLHFFIIYERHLQ